MNTGDIDPNLYYYSYESVKNSFKSMFYKIKNKSLRLYSEVCNHYQRSPDRRIKAGMVALWVCAVMWVSAVLWASPDLRDSEKRLRHEYYCPGPHVF